jgi:hypothetical protein
MATVTLYLSGRDDSLTVKSTDTVATLIQKMRTLLGIKPGTPLDLTYNARTLIDRNASLESLRIEDGDTIGFFSQV